MAIDTSVLAHNPFTVITIIAAPAILTNAASILSLSTSTRFLRCADRIYELTKRLSDPGIHEDFKAHLHVQMNRAQIQSRQFLWALKMIYLSLAAFAAATFVALIGAVSAAMAIGTWIPVAAAISIMAGAVGVLGLVWAGVSLVNASHLTLLNISDDVRFLRRNEAVQTAESKKEPTSVSSAP